jgi:hypothetical protein
MTTFSTYQVLDALIIGQKALCVGGDESILGKKILKGMNGVFTWDDGSEIELSEKFLEADWQLLALPTTYSKAFEALKVGRTVICEIGDRTITFTVDGTGLRATWQEGEGMASRNGTIEWAEITLGKWYVREE